MSNAILEKDITTLLGINTLPKEDQEAFLSDIGMLVLENAFMRLTADMDDATVATFEQTVVEAASPEMLFETLVQKFPVFERLFKEEAAVFKEEVVTVMDV